MNIRLIRNYSRSYYKLQWHAWNVCSYILEITTDWCKGKGVKNMTTYFSIFVLWAVPLCIGDVTLSRTSSNSSHSMLIMTLGRILSYGTMWVVWLAWLYMTCFPHVIRRTEAINACMRGERDREKGRLFTVFMNNSNRWWFSNNPVCVCLLET